MKPGMAHPTHLAMAAEGARDAPFFVAAHRIGLAARAAATSRHWLPAYVCSAVHRTVMRFCAPGCSSVAAHVVRNAAWRKGLRAGNYTPFYLASLVKSEAEQRSKIKVCGARTWQSVAAQRFRRAIGFARAPRSMQNRAAVQRIDGARPLRHNLAPQATLPARLASRRLEIGRAHV